MIPSDAGPFGRSPRRNGSRACQHGTGGRGFGPKGPWALRGPKGLGRMTLSPEEPVAEDSDV